MHVISSLNTDPPLANPPSTPLLIASKRSLIWTVEQVSGSPRRPRGTPTRRGARSRPRSSSRSPWPSSPSPATHRRRPRGTLTQVETPKTDALYTDELSSLSDTPFSAVAAFTLQQDNLDGRRCALRVCRVVSLCW